MFLNILAKPRFSEFLIQIASPQIMKSIVQWFKFQKKKNNDGIFFVISCVTVNVHPRADVKFCSKIVRGLEHIKTMDRSHNFKGTTFANNCGKILSPILYKLHKGSAEFGNSPICFRNLFSALLIVIYFLLRMWRRSVRC